MSAPHRDPPTVERAQQALDHRRLDEFDALLTADVELHTPRGSVTRGGNDASDRCAALARASCLRWKAVPRTVLAIALAVALALALALPSAASARTYLLNFDSAASGSVFGSGPQGLTFSDSPVASAVGSNAFSPPNILRRQGRCQLGPCPSGDHRLVMNFAKPARSVSLRAGVPATENPSCEANGCPLARLVGFDAANRVVAVSPEEVIYYGDMRRNPPLAMSAAGYTIVRAVFAVGENPQTGAFRGYQHTAQIDNLSYDVLETGDPPPPPPPPAPAIQITDPRPGQNFANTDISIRGTASAPAGIAEGCAAANAPVGFPLDCRGRFAVAADGTFSVGYIAGMRPGANEIRVWLRDVLNRTATATVRVNVTNGDVDYAIRTIDVNQVVQVKALPVADETVQLPRTGTVRGDTYDGVPLVAGRRTIARVFGEARGASGPVRDVPAILRGYATIDGRLQELPFSPLRPSASPAQLPAEAEIPKLRAGTSGDWTFVLPDRWTSYANVTLVAEIAPGSVTAPATDCCTRNNYFALKGLSFQFARWLTIYPVALTYRTGSPPTVVAPDAPLSQYYDELKKVWPGRVTIAPPRPAIDVSDLTTGDVAAAWNARLMATFRNAGLNGKVSGLVNNGSGGKGPGPTSATGSIGKGLDFVAHEVGHSTGLAHAHTGSGDGCPSDPNLRGRINGIGIDPELWSGGTPGRFKSIGAEEAGVFDATPNAPSEVFDYMSYCSNEDRNQTWVAAGYWANEVRELRVGGRLILDFREGCCFLGAASDPTVLSARSAGVRAAAAAASRQTVTVSAAVGEGQDRLLNVEHGTEPVTPVAQGSGVHVVVRDAAGNEVSRTPVAATPLEGRPAPGERDVHQRLVNAVVPGAAAAKVEIVVDGKVVASRSASKNSPRVRVARPARGARIGSSGTLTVKWTAADADGDALTSRVEFSADGGRRWKTLGVVPNGGQILKVRRAQVPRATSGILRVRVADGFHVSMTSVTRLRAAGARPTVDITSPLTGTRVRADTTVTLEGQAFDDAARPIAGSRLIWRLGRRPLGRGRTLDAAARDLSKQITLTARDSAGRVGSDRIKLNVHRVAPIFTVLSAKPPTARKPAISVRAASSLPAVLSVSGRGVRTTRTRLAAKTRRIVVKLVGKRRTTYELKLVLSAGARRTTRILSVAP